MNALRTGFDRSVRRAGPVKIRRPRAVPPVLTYDDVLVSFEQRLVANLKGAH